jgi:hypothetical protein
MKPFRAMQTAGLLKGLLDLGFWAIVVVPGYVALVVMGYLRSGDPDMALGVDVWFNPTPVAWALEGGGSRAARIVHGVAAVRFQELPWPSLDVPVSGLFVGAVLLVAAEAFRRGAQLEEDQAFTV